MDIVIWTYIFGGATVFALIGGVFSVWNGRMTRRWLSEVIERTSGQTQQMLERQGQILERHGQMLERIEETLKYVAELVKAEGEKTRSLLTH
ncbi:MAG: hypothetical protein ACOYU0_00875 [Nitrospirota bacterium]